MSDNKRHIVHLKDGSENAVEAEHWFQDGTLTVFAVGGERKFSVPTKDIERIELEGAVERIKAADVPFAIG